jgi:hypothetical protein
LSHRIDLPDEDRVRRVMAEVISEASDNGRRPTVIALARKLGLDNATFRRRFPEIVRELREKTRAGQPVGGDPTRFEQLQEAHAQLKRDHARLAEELDAAQAVIQRLSLENHHLRQQAAGTAKVIPFTSARPRPDEER